MLRFLSPPNLLATRRTPHVAGQEGSALENLKPDPNPAIRLQLASFRLDLTRQAASDCPQSTKNASIAPPSSPSDPGLPFVALAKKRPPEAQ